MNSLTRRRAFQGGAALTALTIGVAPPASAAPFADADVRRTARELAKHPFQEPDLKLPGAAGSMTYDQYRDIRFRQDRELWRGQDLPFQVGFFPRGVNQRRYRTQEKCEYSVYCGADQRQDPPLIYNQT